MNDQQNIEQDDAEAGRDHPVTELNDDVEGLRAPSVTEDDDVEGHSQPPRDIDTHPVS